MTLVRRLARPMLATAFVANGVRTLSHDPPPTAPEGAVQAASRVVPWIPDDPRALARFGAGVQVGAGLLLALGRAPRLAALALASSLGPTGGLDAHDDVSGAHSRDDALRTVGLLGGLLLAAVDTEGRPSLGWRAHHRAGTTRRAARAGRREVRLAALSAQRRAHSAQRRAHSSAHRATARLGR